MESTDLRMQFERELDTDESLLWVGQPSGRVFYPADLIRLAFGLLFAGFPTYMALKFFILPGPQVGPTAFDPFRYFELLFAIPFIVIGVGVIGLGGVIKRWMMMRYTRYAITNLRVIIANTRNGFSLESRLISHIPGLTKRIGPDGVGTIVLGIVDENALNTVRYSMDQSPTQVPSLRYLYEIPGAESVYNLLNSRLREAKPESQTMEESTSEPDVEEAPISLPPASYVPRSVQPVLGVLTILGSPALQFGLFWLGFVLVFVRVFLPGVDLVPALSIVGGHGTATGVVTNLEVTSSSDESGASNKIYTYKFADSNGVMHEGVFHSSGGWYQVGQQVPVEYVSRFPNVSRISGMDSSSPLFAGVIILLFLLIGVAMVVSALKTSIRALRLLRNGNVAVGRLISKTLRKSSDSDSVGKANYQYDLIYSYMAQNGSKQQAATSMSAGLLHVNDPESEVSADVPGNMYVLYDPSNPEGAITVNQLPGHPCFDRPGMVYSSRPGVLIGYLIIPTLVLFVHGLWTYLSMRR